MNHNNLLSLKKIIIDTANMLNIDISINTKPELIRPSDNKIIIGSNEKIVKETGWDIKYSLDQSLKDIISYWQNYFI